MIKILFLIDDDQDDRELFQEALSNCDPDIELIFAVDGVNALEILESATPSPDVIFLDYNMPRMNGVECLQKLKLNAKTCNIPTVMYTTTSSREQENAVLSLGADYYMQKTSSFKELCSALMRLLKLIDEKMESKR